jgi:hypothetical protein
MRHIIKKQTLEFDLDNKLDAFHMQHGMAGFCQYGLLPVLEKIFDELSDDETVIAMDKMEINLGLLTVTDIEKRSPGNLYQIIRSQIKEMTANTIKLKQRSEPGTTHPAVHSSKLISIAGQWLFYMQHGYLAWNTISINETWYNQVLEAFAVDFESTAALRRLITNDRRAVRRIIYQHKEIFLRQLMEILTAEKQTDLLLLTEELIKVAVVENNAQSIMPDYATELIKEKIWTLLFSVAASAEQHLTTDKLSETILNRITTDKTIAEEDDKATGKFHLPDNDEEDNKATKKIHLPDDDGVFVQNAGVVLLHPFLSAFFKRLQLVKDKDFINIDARCKALHLLYFLTTGRKDPEEHELVIPKLLCAWGFEETVPKDIQITEEEIHEATNLLEAAIVQWAILKNTSPDGLREGFLQRNGKLYSKSDNLYLHVETSSIDIVLDYLPWNLGIIKLSWMEDILRVEWR